MHIKSIIELIYVFIAYFILIIVLTSFMIKPIVKNKNIFERIVLYLVIGNFYIINIVFILSYLNIFKRLVLIITILFMSVLIRIILDRKDAKRIYAESKETIKHLLDGEYGTKLFLHRKLLSTKLSIKSFFYQLFKGKKIEWIIFLTITFYNIYYYFYNSVKYVSYGAPDEEVHLYWIQSLIGGNIFPSGVYPHGFHNVLSALTVFFGFHAVTVINCFGVISMVLIMTMLYFGLRKILKSKYAALFGLMVYSITNIYHIGLVFRYQFSLPQEYGMIMLMPMAMFLFKYLKDKRMSNLVFFGMCFSMTISSHFYVAIIALVLCLSVGIVYLYRILRNKLLMKILLCGILSSMIAVAPLAVGLALGHDLEQSMDWAVRVIQGKEYEQDYNQEDINNSFDWNVFLEEAKNQITKHVLYDIRVFYMFLGLIALTILYCILFVVFRNKEEENLFQLSFAVNGLLLIFLILCKALNIPTLMEAKRAAIFFGYFTPIYIAIPFEILYRVFSRRMIKKICSIVTFIAMPVFVLMLLKYDLVRPLPPYFYFQTKGAMLVDCDIMEKYDDYKWTIVAPVNDISVILNNGYHYELSDFILQQENWNEDIEITIPTKYVFIYIEKNFYIDDRVNGKHSSFTVNYEDAKKPLEKGLIDNEYYKEYRNILMSKAYYWVEEYKKYFPKEMSVYYEDDEIIIYRIVQNEYALNNFAINYGENENNND